MTQSISASPKAMGSRTWKKEGASDNSEVPVDSKRMSTEMMAREPAGAAFGVSCEGAVDEVDLERDAAVSADAAESFIENKRIGDRIKYLRQRKHMGLVELGKHTGLSASFLSQLETGRVVPTLRNLARIAMVFSRDLSYFFETEKPELFRIQRASERHKQPQTGAPHPAYYFESLGQVPSDQTIAPYIAEFLPGVDGRAGRSHQHAGNEFLYVLDGCLHLTHDGKVDRLEGGDAVFFQAEAVHSYENMGDSSCTALILTMPETLRGAHFGLKLPMSAGSKPGAKA